MTWREGFLTVTAVLALLACQKESAPPGSCVREREGTCTEYPESRAAAGKRMCGLNTWREGASSCPTANRLGTCAKEGGRVVDFVYGGPPNHFTAETARGACSSAGGQWAELAGSSR